MERRKSRKVKVGNIYVGGDAPITVQSMTTTQYEKCRRYLKSNKKVI